MPILFKKRIKELTRLFSETSSGRSKMTHREVQWVKFQLALKRISLRDIAASAGCSIPMVSQVIHGHKQSANVRMVLLQALEYPSFEDLLADCRRQ